MTSLRLRMIEDMQIRNLAVSTQESYVRQVSRFARHFQKSPELLGPEQIRAYQVYLTKEKNFRSVRSPLPSQHFASSIESPSRKTGPSQPSSRLPRRLKNCPSSSVQRKSCSFFSSSGAGNIGNIAPSHLAVHIDTWYKAVLFTISAVTTLLFIPGSVWAVKSTSRSLTRAFAWVAVFAFVVNAHWYVLYGSDRKELMIGYFFWWLSFLLLALGLFGLTRGETK